ncbi:PREDICTED: CD99 antigen-like protein 2, partial [Bison bison bison]|uniref:CD99 antigen-like protein 2 n=1 Tax=Bison bison bison TaxID=43346 RepID=A0A6P3GTZ2_BISBB
NVLLLLSPFPLLERWDHVTTTTRRPGATRAPAKPAGPPAEDDFNLADALDDQNDRDHDRKKPSIGGGGKSKLAQASTLASCFVCLPPDGHLMSLVKYSALQTQSTEPPPPEPPRI